MKLSFERINTLLAKALRIEPHLLKSSFRPATEKDFDDIVKFRRDYFDEELPWNDGAYLRWRYDFSDSESENRNIFWILEIDGDLLGVIGTECLELVVGREVKEAHHPLDILVKPEFNGLGIGAWLSLAINEKYNIILAVTANENSKSLFNRAYHPMPYLSTWKLMIKSENLVRKHIKSPTLVTFISALFDQILSLRRLIARRASLPNDAEIKTIERFSDEINEWRLSGTHSPGVYRLRSAKFLNWRFVDNPRRGHEIIGLYVNDNLIAYIVYHVWHSPKQQGVLAGIDDFFWNSDKIEDLGFKCENVLNLLITRATESMQRRNATVIIISFYGKMIESILRSMSFVDRSGEDVFGVSTQIDSFKNIIYDESTWFLTDADTHGESF